MIARCSFMVRASITTRSGSISSSTQRVAARTSSPVPSRRAVRVPCPRHRAPAAGGRVKCGGPTAVQVTDRGGAGPRPPRYGGAPCLPSSSVAPLLPRARSSPPPSWRPGGPTPSSGSGPQPATPPNTASSTSGWESGAWRVRTAGPSDAAGSSSASTVASSRSTGGTLAEVGARATTSTTATRASGTSGGSAPSASTWTWTEGCGTRPWSCRGRRPPREGGVTLNRVTWSRLQGASDRVRQLWETSTDGGATWSVAFEGIYIREG
jgi:hypothetical protein